MNVLRRNILIASQLYTESDSGGSTINTGDIVFWNGKANTISSDKWSSSLGTPIGVVVIPKGMLPDGMARMIALKPVDANGNPSTSHVYMVWGPTGDTSLTNHTKVPITTNNISVNSSNGYGYMPSDKFSALASYSDPKAFYYWNDYDNYIPSPYAGNGFNIEYNKVISGNNALSDFNGLSNTRVLLSLGSSYTAANAAYSYKDGTSNMQYYLPAMGELGFIIPRFNEINAAISKVGGVVVDGSDFFWSSTEYSSGIAYNLYTYDGDVNYYFKGNNYSVRPFSLLSGF